MNWHDWENVWRRQDLPVGETADVALLRQTFESKHRKMQVTLWARDLAEIAAALLVAGVFAAIGWRMGRAGWPFVIAVILLLAVGAFFVRERLRQRRHRLGADASVLEKVDADLAELRHQRRLLMNVGSWYIAPIFVAELVVLFPICTQAKLWALPFAPLFIGVVVLFLIGVNGAVWVLNRRAVRRQLEPRLAELEKLRADLTG